MRILKKILFILLILIVLVFVISFFLPKSQRVERSTLIDASPAQVYAVTSCMTEFNSWSPWHDIDPKTEYRYEGPECGVGSKMVWESDHSEVGNGSQEIVRTIENQLIRTQLEFDGQGGGEAEIEMTSTDNNQTKVAWRFYFEASGNPIERYFGLVMDSMLGPMYEDGLLKLKNNLE